MRFQTIALTATLACAVYGMPTLQKRDEKTYDEDGNLKLTFSKETMQIGTVEIDEIFKKLVEACHDSGQCETNDITLEGQLIPEGRGGGVENIELTLGPDGSYPSKMRKDLLDGLKAAVNEIADCEEVTHTDDCGASPYYCPSDPETYTECKVPKFWGINYQEDEDSDAAPPNLAVDLELETSDDKLCEDMMGSLSAIAGAVHGVGGGIFTLLSFACT